MHFEAQNSDRSLVSPEQTAIETGCTHVGMARVLVHVQEGMPLFKDPRATPF